MAPTRQRKASTTQLNLGPGPENTNRKSPPGLSHLTNSSRWSWSPSPWVLHSQAGLSNTTSCRYGLSFCPVIRCSLGMTNKGRLLLYSYLQLPSNQRPLLATRAKPSRFLKEMQKLLTNDKTPGPGPRGNNYFQLQRCPALDAMTILYF